MRIVPLILCSSLEVLFRVCERWSVSFDVTHRSRALTEGPERAAARSFLHGVGYSAEDLAKPIVGVAHCWIETMPCNFNNRILVARVKEGIRAAGATPMEMNTIAISDGITMGTPGMRASLVSREVIADSVELVASARRFDAIVVISGCDKTISGTAIALARLNIPGLMPYGGSIRPGLYDGAEVTIHRALRSSPMAASPARHTASWLRTSRRRLRAAVRSPRCKTTTRSPSTSIAGASMLHSPRTKSARVAAYAPPSRDDVVEVVLKKHAQAVGTAARGALTH